MPPLQVPKRMSISTLAQVLTSTHYTDNFVLMRTQKHILYCRICSPSCWAWSTGGKQLPGLVKHLSCELVLVEGKLFISLLATQMTPFPSWRTTPGPQSISAPSPRPCREDRLSESPKLCHSIQQRQSHCAPGDSAEGGRMSPGKEGVGGLQVCTNMHDSPPTF